MSRKKVIIMGAAGRDFHNFNVVFKNKKEYEVVAFTATQIPNISDRLFPPDLSGELYPNGIPIYEENDVKSIIRQENVDEVIFSYSDVSYEYVMHRASDVQSAGASFSILGAKQTMIKSRLPVIAVCAARTGCGKSAVSRKLCNILKDFGKRVVVIRHPMPYGNLTNQKVQRFEHFKDLILHNCTFEEMEEYEPHLEQNTIVYAGVDYEAILHKAEKECDIIIWDGGNNDLPFYKPDMHITLVDPHRAGHELSFFPGETNLKLADIVIISKEDSCGQDDIIKVKNNIKETNPEVVIIDGYLNIILDNKEIIDKKRVLVVEDGPSVTHGGMRYGVATIAAQRYGASSIVNPRQFAVGSIKEVFDKYSEIQNLLPAVGYGENQIADLEKTINAIECDLVIIGTPIDLGKKININKPMMRVKYEFLEKDGYKLNKALKEFSNSML